MIKIIIIKTLFKLYRKKNHRIRRIIRNFITKMEGGEYYSKTLRKIFEEYHNVKIGMYTTGGCFIPFQVDKYTTIGNYCSIARQLRINNRNHPLDFKSTYPMFYNSKFGYCEKDLVSHIPLEIGHDVWIGHNAIIMPHVKSIGTGAVIGAGAVVNKDIPPYAVVVGNPARVVRYRFSQEVIEELLASKWWEKTIDMIKPEIQTFMQPYEKTHHDDEQND